MKSRFSRPRVPQLRSPSAASDWPFWLDITMMSVWGILMLKYWVSGQIVYLLHPDYMWLSNTAGIVLLAMAIFKVMRRMRMSPLSSRPKMQHASLLPQGWSTSLLLLVGLLGLWYTPRPFASDIALQRGVTDVVAVTRSQPQAFRVSIKPEDKSIVEWVRTLNVYPEPDEYKGQAVDVSGFVIHPPNLPENYMLISRFILTCCAADAYPVGLPVKLDGEALKGDRSGYPADEWFQVKGRMGTETINDDRRLTILATEIESIEEPRNPYDY
ncbi:MAG: TIGR03943 family protein [Cyanobacteria bacterium P01_F01_bin.150]